MKIAIINGPNINLQGYREVEYYGNSTYAQLINEVKNHAKQNKLYIRWYQSNHEGQLVDIIQGCRDNYDAIIINAAAYTHTSIAILDALLAVGLPTVEVHLSDLSQRENFRKVSYLRKACLTNFQGEGARSYFKAMDYLIEELSK